MPKRDYFEIVEEIDGMSIAAMYTPPARFADAYEIAKGIGESAVALVEFSFLCPR